jgi:cytosine/adenosine deaminase-related metal-dependent hydrolase
VPAGRIEPDAWADFLVLDLGHPSLAEVEPEGLVDAWLFGGGSDAIVGTCVGGEWSAGLKDSRT